MRILAVDPGNVTGVAVYDSATGDLRSWQGDPFEVLVYFDERAPTIDAVVCESFIPRPGALTWQPEALYTIGALRYICRRAEVPMTLQSPANAKRFSTDEKLKRLGWYTPSKGGHCNDALRHLLLYCVKNSVVAPESLLGTV